MHKFQAKEVLDLKLMLEIRNDVTSRKSIKNEDGEELGNRYYFEGQGGILELDIYDGETIEDKLGNVFYMHRKAKDGTRVFRLRRPVDLSTDDAFASLFAAEKAADAEAKAEKRKQAAAKAAATRKAKAAAKAAAQPAEA